MHETNTEVSLVTGVEYGGGPEAVSDNSATTVLKGKSSNVTQFHRFHEKFSKNPRSFILFFGGY